MFKVGVIGCGRISATYLDVLQRLNDQVKVCFAVDKDEERAKKFAAHFPECGYSDKLEDLLCQELDCVHILTPHFLHCQQAVACLEAGFHVLTEKPIAIWPEDGQKMIDTARACNRQLGVVSQNRYVAGIQEAKRLLMAGELGEIIGAYSTLNWWRPPSYYACDWKGKWETEGGGVVIDQAIHSLDLVRYLMGCPVEAVQAHYDRRVLTQIEVEDVADAAIWYQNKAVHSFYACNYYASNADVRIEFKCEKGRFVLDSGNRVTFYFENGEQRVVEPGGEGTDGGHSYWGRHHYHQLSEFYTCLAEGRPVPVAPEDALKTLELVQAIYQSSRENRKIFLSK